MSRLTNLTGVIYYRSYISRVISSAPTTGRWTLNGQWRINCSVQGCLAGRSKGTILDCCCDGIEAGYNSFIVSRRCLKVLFEDIYIDLLADWPLVKSMSRDPDEVATQLPAASQLMTMAPLTAVGWLTVRFVGAEFPKDANIKRVTKANMNCILALVEELKWMLMTMNENECALTAKQTEFWCFKAW